MPNKNTHQFYLHFSVQRKSTVVIIGHQPTPTLEQWNSCPQIMINEDETVLFHSISGCDYIGDKAVNFIRTKINETTVTGLNGMQFTISSDNLDAMISEGQMDSMEWAYDDYVAEQTDKHMAAQLLSRERE